MDLPPEAMVKAGDYIDVEYKIHEKGGRHRVIPGSICAFELSTPVQQLLFHVTPSLASMSRSRS